MKLWNSVKKDIQGVEIDYKKEYSQKGLEKFLAVFSNTRGGVIIIGVEEDRKTGCPIKWEGIDDNAKLIEHIYQESCNVTPQPAFEVHKTAPGASNYEKMNTYDTRAAV